MTIEHRIERLERKHPPESKLIDDWLEKHAEPFENDEERKEIYEIIGKLDQNILALKQKKHPITVDIPMNLYPKLLTGLMESPEGSDSDKTTVNG